MIFLLKFWREITIGVLLVVAFATWKAHSRALVERGKALERVRVADSALAVLRPQLARVDTQVVTRVQTVTRTLARVDTLRDSILTRLTDTLYIKEYIVRTDSVLSACRDLSMSCALFRTTAAATIAALEQKMIAQPVASPRSCTASKVVWTVLGAGGGYLGGRIIR